MYALMLFSRSLNFEVEKSKIARFCAFFGERKKTKSLMIESRSVELIDKKIT